MKRCKDTDTEEIVQPNHIPHIPQSTTLLQSAFWALTLKCELTAGIPDIEERLEHEQ